MIHLYPPNRVSKRSLHVWQTVSSALKLIRGTGRAFFSMEWRASASLHPSPLPTRNTAAHSYQLLANRLPAGSGGGLWRIGHLYYITGLQEQRARKTREWERGASPPQLCISLNFSGMSQRQSDSLDALRKRSMTSPPSRRVCAILRRAGGWISVSAANPRFPGFDSASHS